MNQFEHPVILIPLWREKNPRQRGWRHFRTHGSFAALRMTIPRGSVVVVVLVTLLFAALLLTRLIETSSTDLLIAMRVADRDRLRADA